ncbi:MAG: InlB B-repeat-containing protein [Lachnospiraceae bacterium]|nr:InlB B-repeat-containing protein [Lachnospiraceae bacterium]
MKIKRFLAVTLAAVMTLSMAACGGGSSSQSGQNNQGGNKPAQETAGQKEENQGGAQEAEAKTVASAAVTTQPTKTQYLVGEEFDGEGGVVTVTYTDGTTAEVSMTAENITNNLNTEKVGKKSVSIYVDGVKASKTVAVVVTKESCQVTIHYNCEEKADETYEVDKGSTIVEPTLPARGDAFQFAGWFTEEGLVNEYDFATEVTGSVELFAKWVDLSQGAYKFTYIYNYEGAPAAEYSTYNANGTAVAKIADPERVGYAFDGWFTEAEAGDAFDFAKELDTDTTVYAHWTKTVTGTNEWVFEVENTDLSTKTGAGLSGTTSKGGMLVSDSSKGASGGVYLSYQYITGNQVEFVLVSDEEVSDVTLVARLSQEARNYTYNSSNYNISLNGESLDYGDIVFTDVPGFTADGAEPLAFADYTLGTGLTLKKGRNTITFTVANADALTGTTMNAASPLLDCIKLTTEAVVTWDGSAGLPMKW